MRIYLVYVCYFTDAGVFKKVLKKLLKDREAANELIDNYPTTLLQWMEIEERILE